MQLFTFGVKNTQTFVSWKRLKENSLNDKHISKLVSLKFYPVATLEWLKRFRSFNLRKVGKMFLPNWKNLNGTERQKGFGHITRWWELEEFSSPVITYILQNTFRLALSLYLYTLLSHYILLSFSFTFSIFLCPQFILFFFFFLCISFFLTFNFLFICVTLSLFVSVFVDMKSERVSTRAKVSARRFLA